MKAGEGEIANDRPGERGRPGNEPPAAAPTRPSASSGPSVGPLLNSQMSRVGSVVRNLSRSPFPASANGSCTRLLSDSRTWRRLLRTGGGRWLGLQPALQTVPDLPLPASSRSGIGPGHDSVPWQIALRQTLFCPVAKEGP